MKRDELRALLDGAGVTPQRRRGQNFLVEENLAAAIARDGVPDPEDVVLEIGTGVGILTERLVELAHHIISLDIDPRVLDIARDLLSDHENLTLIEADALANKNTLNPVLLEAIEPWRDRKLRVVANLPYNVATSLVVCLLSEPDLPLASVLVMVQLEAAERFAAKRGDPKYGSVSVLCSALCEHIEMVRRVPPDVFMPRPKVSSAVIRLVPRADRHTDFSELSEVVRALFNYRRKTLNAATKKAVRREPALSWLKEALENCGIDPKQRAEELDLSDFQRLIQVHREAAANQ